VLELFAAAYARSHVRALCRGRSRFSGGVGLPVSAVAVVSAVWILLSREPTVGTFVGCAARPKYR
jgi:hypothetical protein